jgi:hypothetical protein
MKFNYKVLVLSILFLQSTNVFAESLHSPSKIGLGIVAGEPTGLTGKFWFSEKYAGDLGVSYSFDNYFLFYTDALYHFPNAIVNAKGISGKFVPYFGGGVGVRYSTKDSRKNTVDAFLRVPIGIEWSFSKPPVALFAEFVPGIGIAPDTYGLVLGGIGIRYYF